MKDLTIEDIIDYVDYRIITNSMTELDVALSNVVVEQEPTVSLIAWLRSSFPVRHKLYNWKALRDDVHAEFTQSLGSERADVLLKGLFQDDV